MSASDTNAVLNRLLVVHRRSLPMYLADAPPWIDKAHADARETLAAIVAEQRRMVDRLGEYILENGGEVAAGEFPMRFTSLHDLSLEFVLKELIQRQRNDIRFIEQAVAALQLAPMAKALAEEALGAAKGHLQSLEELRVAKSR